MICRISPDACRYAVTFVGVVFLSCLSATSALADGELLKSEGARALLTVNISVQGGVEKPGEYRDEVVKWTTRREFKATVEMVADKPDKASITSSSAPGEDQMASLQEMQRQSEACGEDQVCLMQLAMKLMNSEALQPPPDSAPRYQLWRAIEKDGRLEVSGSHQETLNTVFYTGARETTECTLTGPKVSPELVQLGADQAAQWESINLETQASSARSFVVEIDSPQPAGNLTINSLLSLGSADIKCTQNIGSGAETSHHSASTTLIPQGEIKLPLLIEGSTTGGALIASGSASLDTQQTINNLGGVGFALDAVAPLKVVVSWQLSEI
jgi:hypothetical protein